jgi:hypothetical protein
LFDWTVIAKIVSPDAVVATVVETSFTTGQANTDSASVIDVGAANPPPTNGDVITTTPDMTLLTGDSLSEIIVTTTVTAYAEQVVMDTAVSSTIDISSSTLATP